MDRWWIRAAFALSVCVCVYQASRSFLDMPFCQVAPRSHRLDILLTTRVNSAWPSLQRRQNEYRRKLGCKRARRAIHQPRIPSLAV